MRGLWAVAALSVWMTDGACASSFVHVAPRADKVSRSVVVLGEPAPVPVRAPAPVAEAKTDTKPVPAIAVALPDARKVEPLKAVAVSRSIIAFGTPATAVASDKVASIGKRPAAHAQPVVIRGGIVAGVPGTVPERVTLPAASTPRSPATAQADRRQASATRAPASPRLAPEPIEAGPPPSGPVSAPR